MHKKVASLILLFVFTFLGIWGGFFNFSPHLIERIQSPMSFRDDGLFGLYLTKSFAENEWGPLGVPQTVKLGYPASNNLFDYPINDRFGFLMWKAAHFLTNNGIAIFNLAYLFSYFLCGLTFYWLCRKFKVRHSLAVIGSLFYSFLSYHYIRIIHVFLANYFLVPVMIYQIFKYRRGIDPDSFFKNKKKLFSFIGIHLLFSIAPLYYCLFYCSLICFSFLFQWEKVRDQRWRLKVPFFGVFLIVFFLILNILPTQIYKFQNGPNHRAVERDAVGAEIYSLKPANILLPNSNHRFSPLARIKHHYKSENVVEGFNESIGLLGVFGLIVGFLIYLRQKPSRTFHYITRLQFALFALGICGGLGALFTNYFVIEFRCYNRISVFIATLALLSALIFIQNKMKQFSPRRQVMTLALLFSLFVFDSFPNDMRIDDEVMVSFVEDKSFFAKIDHLLPDNSHVLQLPFMTFPETPPIHLLRDYDHLKPYVISQKNIYFSYGSIKGRDGSRLVEEISSTPIDVSKVKKYNFNGILVDLNGYKPDEQDTILADLTQKFGPPQTGGWDNHYAFFKVE